MLLSLVLLGRLEAKEGAWFSIPNRTPASLVPVLTRKPSFLHCRGSPEKHQRMGQDGLVPMRLPHISERDSARSRGQR